MLAKGMRAKRLLVAMLIAASFAFAPLSTRGQKANAFAPGREQVEAAVREAYEAFKSDTTCKNADYIPYLAQVDSRLFGVAVVVAPVVGPTLGCYLSDNFSWHWCFLINGPVGVFAFILVYFLVEKSPEMRRKRQDLRTQGVRFDLVGFLLVATFLGSLELVLDRGQTEDWFSSNFIIAVTALCVLAFALATPWVLTKSNPIIDASEIVALFSDHCSAYRAVTWS